jgi:hypothetical protein
MTPPCPVSDYLVHGKAPDFSARPSQTRRRPVGVLVSGCHLWHFGAQR